METKQAQSLLDDSLDMLKHAKDLIKEAKSLQQANKFAEAIDGFSSSSSLDAFTRLRSENEKANELRDMMDETRNSNRESESVPANSRPRKASIVFREIMTSNRKNSAPSTLQEHEGDDDSLSEASEESEDDDYRRAVGIGGEVSDTDDVASICDWTGSGVQLLTAPPELMMQFRTVKQLGSGYAAAEETQGGEKMFCEKKGTMIKLPSKKGPAFRIKRRVPRWFQLHRDTLFYQRHAHSKTPRGIFSLVNAQVELAINRSSPTGYELAMVFPDRETVGAIRILRCFPDGQQEANEWFVALRHNINLCTAEAALQHRRSRLKRISQTGKDLAAMEVPAQASHYDVLHVSSSASTRVIKRAYYRLARDLHPDKNPDVDPKTFARVSLAFEVLKDDESRADYDLCERLKLALRHGILLEQVLVRGTRRPFPSIQQALFADPGLKYLYLQDERNGTVISHDAERVQLRDVQRAIAGEDENQLFKEEPELFVILQGDNIEHEFVFLKLDTPEARDEFLDGFRLLRMESSVLFGQKLQKMKQSGFR